MRWFVDSNRLSPRQRMVVDAIRNNPSQSHWIQGFAGTGKTLILFHAMEQIAAVNPSASLCYITYTNALVALARTAPGFESILSRRVDIQTYHKFLSNKKKYDYVFFDEVQDTEKGQLAKIKAFANILYVAGDPDQQIYEDRIEPDEIIDILQPQTHELLEVYRLTPRLCSVARSIMPESKLASGLRAAKNPNASITLMQTDSVDDEVEWVWREASSRSRPGDPSVILFPNHDDIFDFAYCVSKLLKKPAPSRPPRIKGGKRDYNDFNQHFENLNIPLIYLGNDYGSLSLSDHKPVVYLMTYYSAKGLDFQNVFIPFLNANKVIVGNNRLLKDPGLGRRLLFVAVTRSRENLFVSYTGISPHPYLSGLPTEGVTRTSLASYKAPIDNQEEFF